jgi:hypothetical protein
MTEPDVTLTVTPLEVLRRLVECDESYQEHIHGCDSSPCPACSSWADKEQAAYDDARAILSAPMPPPPEPDDEALIDAWVREAGYKNTKQARGWCANDLRIARKVLGATSPPPPPPVKRGDVVTCCDGMKALVLARFTDDGNRCVAVATSQQTVILRFLSDITENQGPPEGDEWNGWEVPRG